jgi:hypothetical protein
MAPRKQHAYPTYSKNPMIYNGTPIGSPDVSAVRGGAPGGIPPYSGIGPDLNDPNTYPASWDPHVAQMWANGVVPYQKPDLIPTPGMRIGPLRLSGSGLDAASLAVLSALQNGPRPQGFGQSFAAGLAGGLAQGRFNQAQGRAAANQSAMEGAAQDEKDRRAAAREHATGLARFRWDMMRDAAKAKEAAPVETQDEKLKRLYAEHKAMAEGTRAGNPAVAGAGTDAAYFWGTVAGRGGVAPYGVVRNFKGDDVKAFTAGAQDASGGAAGMVGNAANVSGLKGALGQLQKTKAGFDAMDVLLDKSTNLLKTQIEKVPDTGTQFGNDFARYWNAKMGGTGATNFYAVLQPVQSEATRVITSGTLNGQPISDAARGELQALAGKNFTKKQLIDALDLLSQERGFRKEGFVQSINSLKQQLGLPADSTAAPGTKTLAESWKEKH